MPTERRPAFTCVFLLAALTAAAPLPRLAAQEATAPPEKYRAAVARLEEWIGREIESKKVPSLAIVLVDDQDLVLAKGFGHADAAGTRPATADTLYRVGSVSKPVTALVLMMLAEMGLIDLDEPVQKYLPALRPRNPFGKGYTLRHLLAHRSGLVRESPVGNYFDDSGPSLAATVGSLNGTSLVYEPGSKSSYSNAGLAVVGRVMEEVTGKEFSALMREKLLVPLGMGDSSYKMTPRLREKLADAVMWTYDGREFPAPKFQLGMAPAGELHSSANDMGRLLKFLFARGEGPGGRLLKAETLEQMWLPKFGKEGEPEFGIGFHVSKVDGHKAVRHGGAIYGFATEFIALPEEKVGVVVMAARDVANGLTRQVAEKALESVLAVRAGEPLPDLGTTRPVAPDLARRAAGRYTGGKAVLDLEEQEGRLYAWPPDLGLRLEIRRAGDGLVIDDAMSLRRPVKLDGDTVELKDVKYAKSPVGKPDPAPAKYAGLIGEYGWDHNVLYVLEKDGRLYTLIEWVCLYPLTELSENEFEFPDYGLYHGHNLIFRRDEAGRATEVEAGTVTFPRRTLKGEAGLFTVEPTMPLAELRQKALAATPPAEAKKFRAPDLVDVATLDPTIKLDIRYATKNNFLQTPFYTSAKAFLQRPAAEALLRVHKKLKEQGYGLLIHDAYRPWHVTKMFWDATPEKYKLFVADPADGSRHNRGCAVDLTLYDLATGRPVEMVAGFDEFSDRAYAYYIGGTSLQRWHRDRLRHSMEAEGFSVYPAEWWHFDYRDWREYPILNKTFEELQGQ